MFGCVSAASYAMKMDVQSEVVTQDTGSGALTRTWSAVKTNVPILAEPIESKSASEDSSGKKFSDIYDEWDVIKVHTKMKLTKRHRITNIRDAAGNVVWTEAELTGTPAMTFDVVGELVVFGPFGEISEYQYMVKRVDVQNA
jgi:hypothetical protein